MTAVIEENQPEVDFAQDNVKANESCEIVPDSSLLIDGYVVGSIKKFPGLPMRVLKQNEVLAFSGDITLDPSRT
jgi:hypothetical protein